MSTHASTATSTTGAQVHPSYWDTVPASRRMDLAEQLLAHSGHYPACTDNCFSPTGSIKHPDCFWCGVGAHLDCDYDFLRKVPREKLDEIASFVRAFFRRYCRYLPNNPANTENDNDSEIRGSADMDVKNGNQKGDSS